MKKSLYILLISVVTLTSCDFLDVEPVGQVIPHKVSDYRALLTSAYHTYPNHKESLIMPSDETEAFTSERPASDPFWYNISWQHESINASEYQYMSFYKFIFHTIEVMNNIMAAERDTNNDEFDRKQILAEAHAMRAYAMFDLLNLYARYENMWYDPSTEATDRGVPLYTKIDILQKFTPVSVKSVYELIFSDITTAKEFMQEQKQTGKLLYRFSKDAVTALEARMYLYRGEWQKAYDAAVSLSGYTLVDLNLTPNVMPFDAFTSPEMILALEKAISRDFKPSKNGIGNKYGAGDKRVGVYINGSMTSSKKFITSSKVSFRLSEMYLIAAEAMARLATSDSDGKLATAKAKLKELQVKRFDADSYAIKELAVDAMTKEQLLQEIADERVRELFMEGHRWLDLKRTTRPEITKIIDNGSTTIEYKLIKNDSRYLFDFPRTAKAANPELSKY